MKQFLQNYVPAIKQLPLKKKYTKEELLTRDFLIEEGNGVQIYYAPHNEYINPHAKIFIVGITPGFEQMNTAISTARSCLETGCSLEEIKYQCKVQARFSGALRKNLLDLLRQLKLNEFLHIDDVEELFTTHDELLHTLSLIPYPVFVKGKNYTGHQPKLLKTPILLKYIEHYFVDELSNLHNVLIIPLGKSVEEALLYLANHQMINEKQILRGFPHPSGANAHRFKQLEDNKPYMMKQLNDYFLGGNK